MMTQKRNDFGLFDMPVRFPEKERVTLTQADIERSVRQLAEQSYERMLDTEQLAAGWAEGTCNSIQKDVYI